MAERLHAMWWITVALVVGGIILSLSSTAFGQARASAWLAGQYESVGNEDIYQLIMETNTLVFVVFGSILFGAGILLALAIIGLQLFASKRQEPELDDSLAEVKLH